MNDHELDRLIARVNPYGDRTVANLPTGGAEADLLEELMDSPTLTPIGEPGRPPRRVRRRLVLVAVAAVTALIALGGVVVPRLGGPAAPAPAYAAELIAVAETTERVLIDAPGWKIDRVIDFNATSGKMNFTKGQQRVTMAWAPAKAYQAQLRDRGHDSRSERVEALGRAGTMFHYSASEQTTILQPKGRTFLEIRAELGSERAYRDMLAKVRAVDVDTWLAALPDSVVTPDQKPAVIAQMLADIPRPEGFDTKPLLTRTTTDRYQVGARVTGTVACGWIDQWAAAKKRGDEEGARAAIAALRSAKSWKVLKEMEDQGHFAQGVWPVGDWIAAGKVSPNADMNPKPEVKGKVMVIKMGIKSGLCRW